MKINESTNTRIKIAQWVGAKAQDGKMRLIMITQTIMGVIFKLQNSHSLIRPYRQKKNRTP